MVIEDMHFAFCWCIHDQTDNRKITNFFIGTCKFQVVISLSQASMANSSHLSGKLKILFQFFFKSFPRNICNIHSVPGFFPDIRHCFNVISEIKTLFSTFDKNKDGYLTSKEVAALLQSGKLSANVPYNAIQKVVREVEKRGE